jgi:hypothetical protein
MLLYLLFLVVIIIIYRLYQEGFSNPFGHIESNCLYISDNKGPVKTIINGEAKYTGKENDFVNYDYNSILKKADKNTYFSSNKPLYCRI